MGKEETVNVCSGGWQLVAATLSPRLPWKHCDDNNDDSDDNGGNDDNDDNGGNDDIIQ